MHHHSFLSSSFGSRVLGFALCAGSAVVACSNSDTGGTPVNSAGASAAGSAGHVATTGGSAGATTSGGASGTNNATAGAAGTVVATSGNGGAGGSSAGAAGSATATGGTGGSSAGTGGSPGAGAGGTAGSSNGGSGGSAGSGGSGGSGGTPASIPHTGKWQITALGDSITATTCGPQSLYKELMGKGKTNFAFVGSILNNQSCNGAPNVQTEGHSGYLVRDLVGNGQHASELPTWCNTNKSEVVLMHFGTNDIWNGVDAATILNAYTGVLTDLRAANSKVILFVAQIIPLNPDGCGGCEAGVETLNSQIPGWASSKSTTDSPVYVVDMHSVFDPTTYKPNSTYTTDGVHPNNPTAGQLMADKWYAALVSKGIP